MKWERTRDNFDFDAVFRADDYLYFYADSLKDEYSERECSFLVRELGLDRPMRILDLACGHGRHANRLAALGHTVTGVDRSPGFLAIARKEAKEKGLKVRYLCRDSRRYSSQGEFDCAIHLFSSFGYFPDAENEQVITNIAASLKSGGRCCLDILNRDAFLTDLPGVACGRGTATS
jgi:SAM-dependent methyltransferase